MSPSSRRGAKLSLIGIFLMFTSFIYVSIQHQASYLPPDAYWRYQGHKILLGIASDGQISLQPISNDYPDLLNWVNEFAANFGAPLIAYIASSVTGLSPIVIEYAPLFFIPLVLSQALIARQVVGHSAAFPVAVVFAIANQYQQMHSSLTVHRGVFGWMLLMLMLALLLIGHKQHSRSWFLALLVVLISFLVSFQTLALSSLAFFIGIYISSKLSENGIDGSIIGIIFISIATMYIMISGWGLTAFSKLIAGFYASEGGFSVSIFGSTKSVPADLLPSPERSLWMRMYLIASIVAVLIAGVVGLDRLVYQLKKRSRSSIKQIDIVIAAVIIFAVGGIIAESLVADSGGTNPRQIGMYFLPILGAYLIIRIRDVFRSLIGRQHLPIAMSICILILLVTPAAIATANHPDQPQVERGSVNISEYQQAKWLAQVDSNLTTISDFNFLSTYYFAGGTEQIFIPRPQRTARYSEQNLNQIRQYYYERPETARERASLYVACERMETIGFEQQATATRPNPSLRKQLSVSSLWDSIYDSEKCTTFATD